ncbi:TPA: hypothetical protein ACVO16_004541, partial [Vibrio diabolicus]
FRSSPFHIRSAITSGKLWSIRFAERLHVVTTESHFPYQSDIYHQNPLSSVQHESVQIHTTQHQNRTPEKLRAGTNKNITNIQSIS